MDLTPYVDSLRQELAVAAEAGGEDARELADRLTAPLASAIRLTLLDALTDATAEITRDLAPGSVEVRLRTGEATFAVTLPPSASPADTTDDATAEPVAEPLEDQGQDEDGSMVRINLRLPEQLKARVEQAAAEQGRSVNAWLVRAASSALQPPRPAAPASTPRPSQRFTGWVS